MQKRKGVVGNILQKIVDMMWGTFGVDKSDGYIFVEIWK